MAKLPFCVLVSFA